MKALFVVLVILLLLGARSGHERVRAFMPGLALILFVFLLWTLVRSW